MQLNEKSRDATLVVVTTPPGRGAVAVVVVQGAAATEHVNACLELATPSDLADRAVDRILFGRWVGAANAANEAHESSAAEEVVVCRRSEDRVEVHCHGGRAAVARIVGDLAGLGCAAVDPARWLAAHEADAIVCEADLALAQATTQRTAAILLAQRGGALAAAVAQVSHDLETGNNVAALAAIDALLATAAIGLHLVTPWKVVLAGPPNVGKSYLLNALLGYDRALVFDQPGTTRDIVTATTALDGWPIELSDTAGVRPSNDSLETAGIELAAAAVSQCDLLVVVRDATQAGTEPWFEAYFGPRLDVRNKADHCDSPRGSRLAHDSPGVLYTSATRGDGIAELAAAIVARLAPAVPSPGAAVVFTDRQYQLLEQTRVLIADSKRAEALDLLGSISG
jgi:tRNA modification GTPase